LAGVGDLLLLAWEELLLYPELDLQRSWLFFLFSCPTR
jgi:hypothetical protein